MLRLKNIFIVVILICPLMALALSSNSTKQEFFSPPSKGRVVIGGTFLYVEPTATDGDFQYGTVVGPVFSSKPIEITDADLQSFAPNFRGVFELNFDYQFANSAYDMGATYLRYYQKFSRSTQASLNPFIQNFLGGGFMSAQANLGEKINQADLGFGKVWLVVHRLILHPHLGLRYLSVNRNLDVQYNDFIFDPFTPSVLSGSEISSFQGGGLFADVNFGYPITRNFHFIGYFGSALLAGHLNAKLNANFARGGSNIPYNASFNENARVVLTISERLGFDYQFFLSSDTYLLFEVGYRGDDFINTIERVSPENGFARNPAGSNPPAVNNAASLGIHGPYATLSLMSQSHARVFSDDDIALSNLASNPPGFFIHITNSAARIYGQNADLDYAFLVPVNGSVKRAHVTPGYGWNGEIDLGYLFEASRSDLSVSYSHLNRSDFNAVTAGAGQSLFSLNSSGVATVVFSRANSNVSYWLNDIKLMGGQNFAIKKILNLHVFAGIGYASIKRTQDNNYFDGVPGVVTADKHPELVSTFKGLGPLFGIDTDVFCHQHFNFITHFYTGLLFGSIKSTLDQINVNNIGFVTSNKLTMSHLQFMVPVVGGKIGFAYKIQFRNHYQADFEIGYQGQFYFKAINLLFPNFLTGLGQTNTNLGILGPYLTISLRGI